MEYFNVIKKNPIFKFLSSVKLAVPLMLILACVVAAGTIFESNYNSEYVKLMIYNSSWFSALMILLWINIFAATISRIPFKRHHTGFVITHIGLLTLLVGGMMTNSLGIDGQLRVTENTANNVVVLSGGVIGYQFDEAMAPQFIKFDRKLNEKEYSQSDSINEPIKHLFYIKKYLPFAQVDRVYESSDKSSEAEQGSKNIALSFILKSAFFNVSEWLHTHDNPEMQMGPATLKIVEDTEDNKQVKNTIKTIKENKPRVPQNTSEDSLTIKDKASGKVLAKVSIKQLPKVVNGIKISVKNKFRYAVVAENKLVEGNGENNSPNPALEIILEKSGSQQREIVYEKFPDFSVNKEGSFGLSFIYSASDFSGETKAKTQLPPNHPEVSEASGEQISSTPPMMGIGGNVIEFHVRQNSDEVIVKLFKNKKEVMQEKLQPGQVLQTPWMGITVTLGSLVHRAEMKQLVHPVQPSKGMDLPPSSILVQSASSNETFWLTEGDSVRTQLMGKPATLFYGRETITLPYKIFLNKFTKVDYPGTETPMSYQSLIQIDGTSESHLISMNEPLKKDGFTVYQSSYIMENGRPPDSIFSVNKDPGRPVKYAGSLILCLGIVIFTLMRSHWWKERQKNKGIVA